MPASDAERDWDDFLAWWGTLSDIGGAAALLGWDRETDMPRAGASGRAHLLGTLAALHHRELTDPAAGERLDRLAASDGQSDDRAAMLRLAARDRERALRVPERLVRALSEGSSRCISAWIDARPNDDYAAYAAALTPLLDLKREEAAALAEGSGEPYDALLDQFEAGATAARLAPVFTELEAGLAELLAGIDAASPRLPDREWAPEAQMELARDLATLVGFEHDAGVIARSAHPFTSSPHHGDVRFTTRTSSVEPVSSISAVMHELGHALYDQGFRAEDARTPLFEAPSLGAHEGQSRFWENHIGRRPAFWRLIAPRLTARFPAAAAAITPDQFHAVATAVRPGFIRVEADEVTYNLHIILRFELEVALIAGDLRVAHLPEAWGAASQRLLGLRPATDADGVMQDIHWPAGMFGYFPTYTLGSIYAAQLAAAAAHELGDLDELIAAGDFAPILEFLRARVHRHGRRLPTDELMRQATGRPLAAGPLLDHLRAAYLPA